MGKPSAEQSDIDQASSLSSHFSHPHPLQLLNIHPTSAPSFSSCAACKLDSSGDVYCCTTCDFVIHKKCHSLPGRIRHEFDKAHVLTLQPKPAYPEGVFKCDACGIEGDGFSYHCSPCGTDLHSICASLPMQLTHLCHQHPLSLTFTSPYPGDAFSCDICRRVGTKVWLYRCNSCEFDVHLSCLTTIPRPASRPQPQLTTSRSIPQPDNVMYPPNAGVYTAPLARPPALAPALATPYPAPVTMAPVNSVLIRPYNPDHMNPQGNYGPVMPANGMMRDQILSGVAGGMANGIASAFAQAAIQAGLQEFNGGGGGANASAGVPAAGGGDVNQLDPVGGGGDYVTADGGTF